MVLQFAENGKKIRQLRITSMPTGNRNFFDIAQTPSYRTSSAMITGTFGVGVMTVAFLALFCKIVNVRLCVKFI